MRRSSRPCAGERTIHQYSLRDVVCVVASNDMVHVEDRSASVESLSSEDTAECAVVLAAHLADDGVHGPTVLFLVRQDFEGHAVLLLVTFDGLPKSSSR